MSLPICLAAKFLHKDIYLLEPNITLGRANKFYLNFSKKIICYFSNLRNFPLNHISKLVVIKPLVSKNFYKVKKKELFKKKFCILITGGVKVQIFLMKKLVEQFQLLIANIQLKSYSKQVLIILKI